jgi:cell division septation protein DedD
MLSIRTDEPLVSTEPEPVVSEEKSEEFEIVLGARQVASVLFVATVILAVISSIAYLAGKTSTPKKVEAAAAPPPAVPTLQATITQAPAPAPQPKPAPDAPLFADPVNGAVYLQMGAVEKGIALIFAEGLRKRGFTAFAAPGPKEHIFRVLIGPIPDSETYRKTKEAVDEIGLSTFARKYQQ